MSAVGRIIFHVTVCGGTPADADDVDFLDLAATLRHQWK